jgi:pimeloyl-ACP methyl ester carboxylesterase
VAAAGAGAGYQALASAADARAYPPPGRLVDVGGYRLHIACAGERRPGTPTVVLEDGSAGVGSINWRPVQALVAPATRVCAYDRAGLGWSDPGPAPRTAGRVAAELHALLRGAGEEGPYVLAGHSLGGYFNRVYAGAHPGEVAGMVLVDASHEDQWGDPATQAGVASSRQLFEVCDRVLAPLGLWRLAGTTGLAPHPLLAALPPEQRPVAAANFYRTLYCGATLAEITPEAIAAGTDQVRADRRPAGGLPLVVLTAGAGREDEAQRESWLALQRDLAGLSANSRHEVLAQAQHVSMLLTHSAPVAAAIRDVVEAARSGRPIAR